MCKYTPNPTPNATPAVRFTEFDGIKRGAQYPLRTADLTDLASILTKAEPITARAITALAEANTGDYRAAKHALPMLTAALFTEGACRNAANVQGFETCFVEFDHNPKGGMYLPDVTTTFDLIRPDLAEVQGLIAAFATGKGIRFMFAVPPVHAADAADVRDKYAQIWQHLASDLAARFPDLPIPDPSASTPEQFQGVWNRGEYVYINPHTPPVEFNYTQHTTPETATDATPEPIQWHPATIDELAELTARAEAKGTFEAMADFDGWKSLTAALANTYGANARELAVRLAQIPTPYRTASGAANTRRLFDAIINTRTYPGRRAGFGTIARAFAAEGLTFTTATATACTEPTANAEPIKVQTFVTEAFEAITARVKAAKGIAVLKAGMGAGKTAWAAKFAEARAAETKNTLADVHVIINPNTETVRQHAGREEIAVVRKGVTVADLYNDICGGVTVFYSTPDGIAKLLAAGANIKTLVFDEIHDWPSAVGYRPAANDLVPVVAAVRGAGGIVVGMSATPCTELMMSLTALGGGAAADLIEVERKTETINLLQWAAGSRADLIAYIIRRAREGIRIILHIDRKQDRKAGKAVYDLAEALRAAGVDVRTATATNPEGLPQFQAGEGQVLIATRIIVNGLDIHSDGQRCEAIQYAVSGNGIEAEALMQLGGRFRNAKEVTCTLITATATYLQPAELRANGSEPKFTVNGAYNKAHQRANWQRANAARRQWERYSSAAPGRLSGIREVDGTPEINALAVAAEAIETRNKKGGLPAFIAAFKEYVPLAAPPETFDISPAGAVAAFERTEFEAICSELSGQLDTANIETINTFNLALKAKADGTEGANARILAARFGYQLPANVVEWVINRIAPPELRERLRTPEGLKWVSYWIEGRDRLLGAVNGLITAVPIEAHKGDLHALFLKAFEAGGNKWTATALHIERVQYITRMNLAGGVGADVPCEVLHGIPAAEFVRYAGLIDESVPDLIAKFDGAAVSGADLAAAIRERTALPINKTQCMALLRAVAKVETRTVKGADGKRTTAYVITNRTEWATYGQSFTPRAAIEGAVHRGADLAARRGVPPPRIFRLYKEPKMQRTEKPTKALTRAEFIARAVFDPPESVPF